MRKFRFLRFWILSAFFAGVVPSVRAQQFLGDIRIERSVLKLLPGDTLRLEMELLVRNRAVNSCQSWMFVPTLETEDSEHEYFFPHVVVNGKNKARMQKRRTRLTYHYWSEKPSYRTISVAKGLPIAVDYRVDIPFEEWMGDASLTLQGILNSCGDKRQLLSIVMHGGITVPEYEPYEPQLLGAYCLPASENKQRSVRGEAYLDFRPGRHAILPDFRNNAEELAKIRTVIDEVRRDGDMIITDIFIEGYASPEGESHRNAELSLARARALKEYLQKMYSFSDETFHVSSVGEDWNGLRQLVEESELPAKNRVLAVIDSEMKPDEKEYRMRTKMASVWRQLMTMLFPQLRHVDYQVRYRLRDYTLEEALTVVDRAPEKLSQEELYRVAVYSGTDSIRRDELFDLMLKNYPDDPIANLNASASLLRRGKIDAARSCLEHSAKTLEQRSDRVVAAAYANNLGVLLVKEGDLDGAEPLLQQAADAGLAEARANLAELEKKRADDQRLERYRRIMN